MLLNTSEQSNEHIPSSAHETGEDFNVTLLDRIEGSFPKMTDHHAADEDKPSALEDTRRCCYGHIAGFADTSEPKSKSDMVAWRVQVVV